MDEPDNQWFQKHRNRKARIRLPREGEAEDEFLSLGPHNSDRRRMIIVKVRTGPWEGTMMPIPFLAFADEEIANEDEHLMPIVHSIMQEAKDEYE
jgi:hypothetical protein